MLSDSYTSAMPGHAAQRGWFASCESFERERELVSMRQLIWIYFALLIIEGALRKWTMPALSGPLLVIRDPVALLIYAKALRTGRFPASGPVLISFFLFASFVLLAVLQISLGIGGGPLVAAYGLRTYFLHLPLIFVIPQVFSPADVIKVGRWILILAAPMAALMVLQYLSPPGSWINASTVADKEQISFALGKIRPAGTFSFATGAAHFFVLATSFLMYAFAERRRIFSGWLTALALLAVVIVQPASGSRLLVLGCGLVLLATVCFGVLNPARSSRILGIAALLAIVALLLAQTSFFSEAVDTFMVRWNNANTAAGGIQEGLVYRFLNGFLEPIHLAPDAGFLGQGIGMGTNAASALLTGASQFLLAEGEWARIVLEVGPFLGFAFILYRIWMAGSIANRAFWAAKRGCLLPWLLAWDAVRSLLTEQTAQPTNLGFMVLTTGLCLAVMPRSEPVGSQQ